MALNVVAKGSFVIIMNMFCDVLKSNFNLESQCFCDVIESANKNILLNKKTISNLLYKPVIKCEVQ